MHSHTLTMHKAAQQSVLFLNFVRSVSTEQTLSMATRVFSVFYMVQLNQAILCSVWNALDKLCGDVVMFDCLPDTYVCGCAYAK